MRRQQVAQENARLRAIIFACDTIVLEVAHIVNQLRRAAKTQRATFTLKHMIFICGIAGPRNSKGEEPFGRSYQVFAAASRDRRTQRELIN